MPVTYAEPKFDPKDHGFHFNNTFTNVVLPEEVVLRVTGLHGLPVPDFTGGNPIRTSGRCGGMTYAVLDFFLSKRFSTETDETHRNYRDYLPPDGDTLGDYILQRQFDSFHDVADEFVLNWFRGEGINPLGTLPDFAAMCRPSGSSHIRYRHVIKDLQQCVPVALLSERGLIGHQVLGFGYYEGASPNDFRLHIYDPNYKHQELVLLFNSADNSWERHGYQRGSVGVVKGDTFHAWVPAQGYEFKEPDIYGRRRRDRSGEDLRAWSPPRKQDLRLFTFRKANFDGNPNLASCDFTGVVATDANFSNTDLSGACLRGATLSRSHLVRAKLRRATFDLANISNARFDQSDLSDAKFRQVESEAAPRFALSTLNLTNFEGANVEESNFDGTVIAHSIFTNAKLARSSWANGVTINSSMFSGAKLDGSSWPNVTMNTCCFQPQANAAAASLNRADFSEAAIVDTNFASANLSETQFPSAALNNVDLSGCDLSDANFVNARLDSCKASGGRLAGAHWVGSALNNVDLFGSDLTGANFAKANLNGCDLRDCTLSGSNWAGATVHNCRFDPPTIHLWAQQGLIPT